MKSDVIHVTSFGEGTEEALAQADASAAFKGLSKKESLHLRLLTEEMMSLVRALTGEKEADFWIEENGGTFCLNLKTLTVMNSKMREQLLKSSTSGKNTAAKGLLGKIRDLLERCMEPADDSLTNYYPGGWMYAGTDPSSMSMASADVWSFNRYREAIKKDSDALEEWDELEKSILAKIADEIKVNIQNDIVYVSIYKTFK
ncbi:MAG: hypothetical protein K5897_06515 [Eubacterium sp.]|nr:hypothetical protein [Eubacterium sp.]